MHTHAYTYHLHAYAQKTQGYSLYLSAVLRYYVLSCNSTVHAEKVYIHYHVSVASEEVTAKTWQVTMGFSDLLITSHVSKFNIPIL